MCYYIFNYKNVLQKNFFSPRKYGKTVNKIYFFGEYSKNQDGNKKQIGDVVLFYPIDGGTFNRSSNESYCDSIAVYKSNWQGSGSILFNILHA